MTRSMTGLISALLLAGSFAFASSAALANWKSGPSTQGGSTNPCTAGSPGCTTPTVTNNGGNNPQPCSGPAGQCK